MKGIIYVLHDMKKLDYISVFYISLYRIFEIYKKINKFKI